MDDRLKDTKPTKRSSDEHKDTISHRGLAKVEERSCSEPPSLASTVTKRSRLTTIKETLSDEQRDFELSKSSSNQFNESDIELDGSTSTTMMQTTPTPSLIAYCSARRINSETNLNDATKRLSGFLGNKSKRFCSSTSELNFSSHLDTRKSLFSPRNNALSRQSFNSSLYGSNLSLNSSNSRLFMTNSPFYDGKTMYGGASAYTKRDTTQHKFLRVPVLMRPTTTSVKPSDGMSAAEEGSGKSLTESNATKRILEIMNDFKGPLKEARSMGTNISSFLNSSIAAAANTKKRFNEEDRERSLTQRNLLALNDATKAGSNQDVFNSYMAASPTIPSMSQLLRMKKLQSNTEKVREIANRSDCFLNKNTEYMLPTTVNSGENEPAVKTSMKMKNNIIKNLIRIDNKKSSDETPAAAVNLPNIQIPLKNIPKFDLPTTIAKMPPTTMNSIATVPKPAPIIVAAKPAQMEHKMIEILPKSSPSSPAVTTTKRVENAEVFKFSKPLSLKNNENFAINRATSLCFTFAKPSANFESAMAASTNGKNSAPISSAKPSKSAEVKRKFTVDEESHVVDLCCDSAPSVKDKATKSKENGVVAAPKDDLFASLVKSQSSQKWECDACMTRNDTDKVKCACCETPRPGAKASSEVKQPANINSFMPAAKPTDDLFKSIVAKQKTENWECGECLTRNDASHSKCLCCEAAKPGAVAAIAPKSSFNSFSSAPTMPADEGFKSLVSKQNTSKWECSACMTRNNDSSTKCACCEQPKPNSESSSSQFSFGSSLKSKVVLPDPAKVTFSFGMNNVAAAAPAVELPKPVEAKTFSFGATSAPLTETLTKKDTGFSSFSSTTTVGDQVDAKKDDKLPAAPAAVFGGFKFGMPAATTPKTDETPAKPLNAPLLPPANLEKEKSPLEIVKTDTTTLTKSNDNSMFSNTSLNDTKASSFSFGASSELNKTSSLFGNSEAPSMGMFGSPANQPPPPSFSASIIANNNNSLFGVKDDKKIATVESKPSGGFSFGASNSTPSSMFTFGASKPTNADDKPPVMSSLVSSPSFSSLASNNNNNNGKSAAELFVFGQPKAATAAPTFPALDTSNTQNNFQFNAPNEIKSTTFNFTQKQPVQAFSFGANTNSISAVDNKNIFQFGQTGDKVAMPIVANAVQLGGVENAEIPINPLGSFTTAQQNPRKILRVRRTVQRR